MKISLMTALLSLITLAIEGQALDTTGNSATNSVPRETVWTVVSRDANSRVWQQTNWMEDAPGEWVPQVNSYTELQTGLYYLTNGNWTESKEEIDLVPGGGAQAVQGQHQVYFPADIYSGVIETVTGSGQQLKSRPLGICYFDGTNSVLIAELTNSVGQLISANQVVYTNAFTDFPADLLTTYRKSGLECDLVFRSQIPAPEVFGLSSAGCRLELLTEFFDTQDPQAIPASVNPVNGLSDSTLTFGSMAMVHGKAFRINGRQGLSGGVSVSKTWAHLDGRTFLIEEVPYSEIRPSLQMLPALAPAANTNVSMQAVSKTPSSVARASTGGPALAGLKAVSGESVLHKVSTSRLLPPRRIAQSTTNTMRLAKADIASKAGVVWDYNFVNSQSNMTFRGDMTYYVSNNVNLSGTTTIEGGAVIKYDTNYNCSINILGTVNCETGPYRPAILTSANDLSVGEGVTVGPSRNNNSGCIGNFQILEVDNNTWFDGPSSGLSIYIYENNNLDDYEYEDYMPANTTNYYVLPAQGWQFYAVDSYSDEWNLDFSPTEQNGDLQVWGFDADSEPGYYQSGPSLCMPILPVTALTLANGGSLHDLFIRNVGTGIESSGNFSVTNIQFVQIQDAALDAEGVSLYAGNVLMSQVGIGFGGKNFNVESEQLTFDQGSDLAYDWGEADYGSSSSVALTNALITSVLSLGDTTLYTNDVIVPAAGSFAYQSVGAGNYYLSGAYAGASVSPGLQAQLQQKTTYPPTLYSNSVAQGNTTLGPQVARNDGAIGYHYDPIDYLVDYFWITNGTLILTNGVVLAGYNDQDILVTDGGSIISMGTPLVPNWLTRYSCVQEQPLGLGAYATNPVSAYMVNPWHVSTAPTGIFRFTKFSSPAAGGYHLIHTGLNNSFTNLLVQDCEFWSATNDFSGFTNTATVLKNNLFARSGINAVGSAHTNNSLAVSNNLFWNMGMNIHTGQNSNAWYFFNNDFDNCSLTFGVSSQLSVNGYNAYLVNTNRLKPTNASDIVTTNDIAYQTGPLGIFYQPTNSILTNAGSCTGGAAGLYHYTTATNEVPETNSIVDIGYHYVALDTNGNPLCFTGDGIPDYVADSNGNGVYDPGIDYADWLLGIVIQPQSQNVVQGANATFSVVAGGTTPFSYQWMFNGTNISGATSSILTLLVVTTNNEGNYSVVITNSSRGALTSSVAVLSVNIPLQITNEPASQTVLQGTNVNLSVGVSGNYPSYQWYRNGVIRWNDYQNNHITGAESSTLSFSNVLGSDAGNYTVVVANLFNTVTSSPPAVLTVITNPGIGTPPGNVTNIQGNDVALSVTANGMGLNYQWWLTNSLGTNAIPGATNATYRKLAVQTNDAGAYGVIITNLAGSTNAKGTLTVLVPPWFTNQPASITTNLGSNATFSVAAFGTANLSYQWFKNGTKISSATSSSLTLTNVQISDAAGYFLVASNIAGTNATAWAWLNVVSNGTTYNGWGTNSQPPTNTPAVSMISPTNTQATNPAIFLYGTNISIHASATSAYDYVTNVAFYTNAATSANLLGSAVRGSNAMFAFGWTTALHGTNVLLAVATDNLGLSSTSSNVYVVMDSPPTNFAGPSQTLVWHTNIQSTNLTMAGAVSDDGLPFGVTNVLWSVVASNGSVSFSSLTNTNSTVTFTNYGTYDLRLWADDGFVTNYSDCTITWLHPPVVSITSPTNGSQFLVGTSIVLSASAYGLNTTVTNVQFYNGSNSLGIAVPSTGNMYNFDWTNAPLWTNGVTAVAEDNHGLYATSMVTTVVVVPPLAAWIISPTNGQLFVDSPTNILLTAQVLSFVSSSITSVSFSNGFVNLGAATNAGSYTWQLSSWGATNGSYTLTVVANDSAGHTATNSVGIIVNAMPVISITGPTNLSPFQEVTNVTINATASDSDGHIANVAFYGFGTNLPFTIIQTNTTNYSLTWSNLAGGYYPVAAVATDDRGASSVSQICIFKVTPTNTPPSVSIVYPTNMAVFPPDSDLTITATATGGSTSVTNVEFFVNGQSIGSDPDAPYSITRCCWKPGTYVIVAKATDAFGSSMVSVPVTNVIAQDTTASGNGYWDPVFGIPITNFCDEGTIGIQAICAFGTNLYFGFEGDDSVGVSIMEGTNWIGWDSNCDGDRAFITYPSSPFNNYLFSAVANGSGVYAAASGFYDGVAKWDGTSWSQLGNEFDSVDEPAFHAMCLGLVGPDLYAGGTFLSIGGDTNLAYIAKWNPTNSEWEKVGNGLDGPVWAIAELNGKLVIGGTFTNAGSFTTHIAELNGQTWTNFGAGVGGTNLTGNEGGVYALAACGSNLYAGGDFTTAGGNTNANGLAVWNGQEWKIIGNGLAPSSSSVAPIVYTISPHGNTVYAGGHFMGAWDSGSNVITSHNIVRADWHEDSQVWTWSSLDQGVGWGPYQSQNAEAYVLSTCIVQGPNPDSYDLYVGGTFFYLGTASAELNGNGGTGLWRVGQPGPLSISITNPPNNSVFTNPSVITITAVSTATNVNYVELFENGVSFGDQPDIGLDSYSSSWYSPSPGAYLLRGTVVDFAGNKADSAPVLVTVVDTNNTVFAQNDYFDVVANGTLTNLYVLTNDFSRIGNNLSIIQVVQGGDRLGTVQVSFDQKTLVYKANADTYGWDNFAYSVTDGVSTNSAIVTVHVEAPPDVELGSPEDGGHFLTNTSISLSAFAVAFGGNITNVSFYTNGVLYRILTNGSSGTFTTNWSGSAPGFYSISAVAKDNYGNSSSSGPVTIVLTNLTPDSSSPIATITNLVDTTNIDHGVESATLGLITNGLFDLRGQASDSGLPVAYAVELFCPTNWNSGVSTNIFDLIPITPPTADVTPGPKNAQGFHIGGDVSGDLGQLDLTAVPNGIYDLVLRVRGGTEETDAIVRVQLQSELKIGQFSFSEQDLGLPVNGVPLTVTRTYNSLNPDSGPFGTSWGFAMNDMDIQLDDERQDITIGNDNAPFDDNDTSDNGLPKTVSMRTGGGWDVTLTLPNGHRTTFQFSYYGAWPDYYAQWIAPAGIKATLQPINASDAHITLGYDGLSTPVWTTSVAGLGSSAPFDNQDFPGWILTTTTDGTKYYVTRESTNNILIADPNNPGSYISARVLGPPKLSKIQPISGDSIVIGDNGIFHYDPANNLTRAILFDRDGQGRITALHDPVGGSNGVPVVKYVYDNDNNNLVQVLKLVDRNNSIYTTNKYVYGNSQFLHYITEIDNGEGVATIRNLYDASGRQIGIIDAAGKTNSFVYNLNAQTETVYDRTGNPTVYTYDLRGNVTTIVDALGRQTSRTYDDAGNVTSFTDALTNTYSFTYDSNGNQTSVVDPLNHTNYASYNNLGQLTATTNALGFVMQFQYDSQGNQTNTVDALNRHFSVFYDQNGSPTIATDALNHTNTIATYDAVGNLATLSNGFSGSLTTCAYDANGDRTGASNVWVNPNNSSDVRIITNQAVYDAQGQQISSTDPDGKTSIIAYNDAGSQTQVTDPYNRTIRWIYDAKGNIIQIIHSDGTISQMVYDDDDRLSVSDDNHIPGAVVNGTRFTYDAAGQVIESERLTNVVITVSAYGSVSSSAIASLGGVIGASTYEYDLAGRQLAITNGFGNVTRYKYDAVGNQTTIIDALSNRTDNVYDSAGRLVFTTNALGRATQFVYDQLNHPVSMIYPDGSSTAVTFGADGERLGETNQLGLVTTYGYDSGERPTNIVNAAVLNPESGTSTNPQWGFTYDNYGQIASVRNPKGRFTGFKHDQLGRPLTSTLPLGQTASRVYDSLGRIFRKIDFKGQTNEFIYDALGRLTTNQFYAVGSSTPSVLANYTYDDQDRIHQIVEARGMTTFTYDSQCHIQQIASPEATMNYEYEPIEGRRTRAYTSNTDLHYTYDELGRIKTVTLAKRDGVALTVPEVTTNTYTALGSLQDVYYPNGVHALYQYNVMNHLTNLVYTSGTGQLLAHYVYAPNAAGQWKTATEIQRQSGTSFSTNQFAWFYDNLGRLTNETCSSTVMGLSYTNWYVLDILGNRLWQTNILGSTTQVTGYTYNTNDQLLVESSASVTFTNQYDANGSLTNRTSGTETNGYAFNLQNQLESATINRIDSGHAICETISYTYDYKGNRVRAQWSRSIDGAAAVNGTNIFVNGPNAAAGLNNVLEELPAIGATPSASYTLDGSGEVVTQERSGIVSHLLPDGHGSLRLLADTNANIVTRFTYDAYGKPLDFTANLYNAPAATLLYSGGQFDTDLQQYNLQARYYNAVTGRFGQVDPFAAKQETGANLYAYCEDDPVNSVDPTGLYEIDVHQFLTRFLAEKAGFGTQAEKIAKETQALDSPGDPRDAMYGGGGNTYNMAFYHFVSRSRLGGMWHAAFDYGRYNGHLERDMGEYFHALEDTYAHCTGVGDRNWEYHGNINVLGFTVLDNGGYTGHGHLGHEPDHTWRDVPKGMKMAEKVYSDLVAFRSNDSDTTPSADWTSISKQVEDFLAFQPDVYKQTYKIKGAIFTVENATFGGYNKKIHRLDSGYNIDRIYADDGVYKDVTGQRPSTTITGATSGLSLKVSVANSVAWPFVGVQ